MKKKKKKQRRVDWEMCKEWGKWETRDLKLNWKYGWCRWGKILILMCEKGIKRIKYFWQKYNKGYWWSGTRSLSETPNKCNGRKDKRVCLESEFPINSESFKLETTFLNFFYLLQLCFRFFKIKCIN